MQRIKGFGEDALYKLMFYISLHYCAVGGYRRLLMIPLM